MGRVAAVLALLAVGCSSSSNSLTCCFDINGNTTSWICPNQASFNQCCGGQDPGNCGTNIIPANTCTQMSGTTCNAD
jgi:hypothetical protein